MRQGSHATCARRSLMKARIRACVLRVCFKVFARVITAGCAYRSPQHSHTQPSCTTHGTSNDCDGSALVLVEQGPAPAPLDDDRMAHWTRAGVAGLVSVPVMRWDPDGSARMAADWAVRRGSVGGQGSHA